MSYTINKTQARTIARADLTIFNETQALMKQVITDAGNGLYETTVSGSTTMTDSTPTIIITGSAANPTITGTPNVILGGVTVTLGASGLNLNAVIADINDAAVSGLVASKNAANNLVLTYTAPAATTWTFVIGAGSANAGLGLTAGTSTATNPDSVSYFTCWQGSTQDSAKTDQMNQVELYFRNLGYTITRLKNATTNKTFKWQINY
tara:strand:- start:14307 stop:14927 length:621 start_codon:yes stop_codon:yes gene_type:complete